MTSAIVATPVTDPVDHDTWWAARLRLLEQEKDLTRRRDALSAARRALPMREITEPYVFEGEGGRRSLAELFRGRRQLVVFHFMAKVEGYDWCPICSFWVDNIGHLSHFHARDTEVAVVCAEPLAGALEHRRRMQWDIPWYSCDGTSFYDDLHVRLDDSDELDAPGVSAFLRDGDRVLYAYSTYRRGSDILNGTYNYLDITPMGRQETDPEDPMGWLRHHDSYDDQVDSCSCGVAT